MFCGGPGWSFYLILTFYLTFRSVGIRHLTDTSLQLDT